MQWIFFGRLVSYGATMSPKANVQAKTLHYRHSKYPPMYNSTYMYYFCDRPQNGSFPSKNS